MTMKAPISCEHDGRRPSVHAHVQGWRSRMASDGGKEVYRRRKLTEHAYAKMKNRGFGRMLVHGIAAVRSVCMLHAIAHNLLHAQGLRSVAA